MLAEPPRMMRIPRPKVYNPKGYLHKLTNHENVASNISSIKDNTSVTSPKDYNLVANQNAANINHTKSLLANNRHDKAQQRKCEIDANSPPKSGPDSDLIVPNIYPSNTAQELIIESTTTKDTSQCNTTAEEDHVVESSDNSVIDSTFYPEEPPKDYFDEEVTTINKQIREKEPSQCSDNTLVKMNIKNTMGTDLM